MSHKKDARLIWVNILHHAVICNHSHTDSAWDWGKCGVTLRMLSLPAVRSHAYVRAFFFLGWVGGGGVI